MPIIEGGGVERIYFNIKLSKDKLNKISLITVSKNFRNRFDKKLNLYLPEVIFGKIKVEKVNS